ncbi:unnamed protein product [Spodoptera littoralis]|uniref:Enhancer of polycomb-like protein n=1 Tax=Spodoptera littoralis TaxID=7109 RepID=A0A9P0ID37_SPOLI|nr:unnamed protein product [Spodoptera littoralis]CAH1643005.1 unnamed protein product [Spodoptera littoralis]
MYDEHHLQRAISGTGLIIPTPEVCQVSDLDFYERCYPPDYKMPKQHIHMQQLKFEQMMDKLEKSSGQTVVTLNEAKLLLERNDDLVIAVYDYWLNKRLNTQHPLILSVKTENRPGQSSNNPYLAFRRRTEKMQTRKNRKNDESSYEKMLKLRRDLARALSLLELVSRRENAKRELVRLTALIAERRYHAGDFANQLLPEPPPRTTYSAVPISSSSFRREPYPLPHYPPRPPPTPVDQPRQREKRPYKRRKHRHPVVGSVQGLRDSGVYTSSEEESSARAETSTPPDDGPFTFRRKPGCYYEMPTSTLYGDPLDPEDTSADALCEHEVDERHRYVELETKAHRTPKEMTRDYHTSGKYPWRHAFRRHLARNPELWTKPDPDNPDDGLADRNTLPDVIQDSVKSDIRFSARTIDEVVQDNLQRVMRKRSYSGCSDSSYDSDEPLQPVEKEFEQFINEVNKKWLHFRPKTPPPSPPRQEKPDPDQFPIALDTPISVELRAAEKPPTEGLDSFTTSEFTLGELYPDITPDIDNSAGSLDISGDDLLTENFTETDLKALAEEDDKKIAITDDILDELVNNVDAKDSFLLHGQSSDGRADSGPRKRKADAFGSTVVNVTNADKEIIYVDMVKNEPPPPVKIETPKPIKEEKVAELPAPVPTSNIIVEEVNEIPHIKIEKKRKEDTIEEVQLPHGVQLKTVQTKHSPLKKHIITSTGHRRASDVAIVTSVATEPQAPAQPQIVRLQNHLLSAQSGVLVQNGPFSPVVAVPVQSRDNTGTVSAASASASSTSASTASAAGAGRRLSAPLVQLAGGAIHKHVHVHAPHAPLVVAQSHLQHVPPSKLKVLHAHPLTQSQRTALLAQNRALGGLPTVVSLAALDGKAPAALLKAAPGSVAQLFEIKAGQLGKGPHLVNVVRQPAPRAPPDDKRRVNLSLDGRQLVRAALPGGVRHQIQLKSRALGPVAPRALVANLLHKAVPLPRAAHKIALGGAAQPLSANVSAIAFAAPAQLKRRLGAPRAPAAPGAPPAEPAPSTSGAAAAPAAEDAAPTNGSVRRRAGDTVPMEVT